MKKVIALVLAASVSLVACGSDNSATEEVTETTAMEVAANDIVAVASSTEGFSTLVAAVTAAGLVETLQGEGPFTVFAPTDEAFAALPAGLLDKLLLPENIAVLTSILTYHVVSGKVMSTDVMAGDVPTVEGSTITLGTTNGVQVNDATVLIADVEASNGVIHAIDKVLVPPSVDLASL
ncbi:MAG: fasciclin domain-containing protein [Actinobacteria bacterium]|nr:fasciclin domain-containing protein [Actinomycetota bacterium]